MKFKDYESPAELLDKTCFYCQKVCDPFRSRIITNDEGVPYVNCMECSGEEKARGWKETDNPIKKAMRCELKKLNISNEEDFTKAIGSFTTCSLLGLLMYTLGMFSGVATGVELVKNATDAMVNVKTLEP